MPGPNDVLSQLLGASWRGISIPTLMVSARGGHNVVAHKRVDRDGWRVENTGRNSYVFVVKVPFINTITPGPNESWGGALYPTVFTKVMKAIEDRSSGPFVHPIFGARNCKVADGYEIILDPDFRGGPTLSLTLFESVDDADASLSSTSVQSVAVSAAETLDAFFAALPGGPPNLGTGGLTLSAFLAGVFAIVNEVSLITSIGFDIAACIDALTIQEVIYRDQDGFSDAVERLISALHAQQLQRLQQDSPYAYYIVPKRSSVSTIANRVAAIAGKTSTANTVSTILQLNPQLAASPFVAAGTAVRYYG